MNKIVVKLFLTFSVLLRWECTATATTADQKHLQVIEGSMDLKEAPCDNFFKYACAEWQNLQPSPVSENIQVLDNKVNNQMLEILESFPHIKKPHLLTSVYNYYQSCQDTTGRNPLEYLKWMNNHENVSWALVGSETVSQNWIELLALTRMYGFNEIFLHEDIIHQLDTPFKLAIELKRPALAALDDFHAQMYSLRNYMDADVKQQFSEFQKQLLNITVQLIKSEENGTLEFVQNTLKKPSGRATKPMTLGELKMPWLNRYLEVVLNQTELNPNMTIYIHSVKYFETIYEFVSQRDNNFICEYIQMKFLKFLQDKDANSQRGDCLQSTRHLFPLVMQWAYEKNNLQLLWQTSLMRNLFEKLKTKFNQTLMANNYGFSEDIVLYLKTKLDNLQLMLAHISLNELELVYGNLTLKADEYYGNRLKIFQQHWKLLHAGISQNLTKTSPQFLLLSSSGDSADRIEKELALQNLPRYYPKLNAIFLPVTMLQSPYYEDGLSDLYTYSSMGFHLSHEIVKAFDQRYLRFDALGIVNAAMYEQILGNPKFQRSNERLRSDFQKEFFDADEVIDDLGGLQLAYDTFAETNSLVLQASVSIHNDNTSLERIFFLNYAQNFCGPLCGHSMMGFLHYDLCDRVNRPVMHSKKFLESFKCIEYDQSQPMWH